ncbi:hypothetical protein Tco_0773089 [Tanacetum coccineum]|uniref:Uncharacterized protein n=1 Tax=Tanacetum coccineum TaxID=301880 RepID=A0ABQ4ZNK3_9ASTR
MYERGETDPPLTKEQIEGHISAMKSIIKDYNRQNKADLIRLDFGTDNIPLKEGRVAKGKDIGEEDLSKPFNEKLKTPLTRRIIEFAGLDKLRRMAHASLVSDVSANIGRRSQRLVREPSTQ